MCLRTLEPSPHRIVSLVWLYKCCRVLKPWVNVFQDNLNYYNLHNYTHADNYMQMIVKEIQQILDSSKIVYMLYNHKSNIKEYNILDSKGNSTTFYTFYCVYMYIEWLPSIFWLKVIFTSMIALELEHHQQWHQKHQHQQRYQQHQHQP